MKKRLFPILLILFMSSLYGEILRTGLNVSLGTAIGTGKGYWDWTDPALDIQRQVPFAGGVSLPVLLDWGELFQLESGVGYYRNRSEIRNGDTHRLYRQDTIEVPLALRLFLKREDRLVYIKGGTALIYLNGAGLFRDVESGENFFTGDLPENRLHAGLQIGTGSLFPLGERQGQIEFSYLTFYSSPDYPRTDGTAGNVRFHRFAMTWGILF